MGLGEEELDSKASVYRAEGIAVHAVLHLELALEVERPDRVGLVHRRERLARGDQAVLVGVLRFGARSSWRSKIRSIVLTFLGAQPSRVTP